MAATFQPHPISAPAYGVPRHPDLRLLPGGRSPARLRATYRRRRLAVAALALLTVLSVLAVGRGALSFASPAPPAFSSAQVGAGAARVVVQPGDTLWSIARRLQPTGDVRSLVDRLAAAHGSGPLQPGERLPVAP